MISQEEPVVDSDDIYCARCQHERSVSAFKAGHEGAENKAIEIERKTAARYHYNNVNYWRIKIMLISRIYKKKAKIIDRKPNDDPYYNLH